MLSVAVKQSGRPVSISTSVMINMIRTLTADDSLLTQCEIGAHLVFFTPFVLKDLIFLLKKGGIGL